jgi:hypothetical protein
MGKSSIQQVCSGSNILNVLFWNFNCKAPDAASIVVRLVSYHQIDILALAESALPPEIVLKRLQAEDPRFDRPADPHHRVQFFTRFPGENLELFRYDERLDLRRLRLPGRKDVLLGAIHFYDRRNYNPDAQHSKCSSIRQTLRDGELDAGHRRTILMGDFNMNPFEKGMIDAEVGFGAVLNRDLASRLTVDGNAQRFYNPMWARLGRSAPEPPGTFYWHSIADPLNIFWHHLDQVLIRPDLLDAMIELIRSARKHWVIEFSDHLPIQFRLVLPEEENHA